MKIVASIMKGEKTMPSIDDIKNFIADNWTAIVKFFDALWNFAKNTVLKDDSIFAEVAEEEE